MQCSLTPLCTFPGSFHLLPTRADAPGGRGRGGVVRGSGPRHRHSAEPQKLRVSTFADLLPLPTLFRTRIKHFLPSTAVKHRLSSSPFYEEETAIRRGEIILLEATQPGRGGTKIQKAVKLLVLNK